MNKNLNNIISAVLVLLLVLLFFYFSNLMHDNKLQYDKRYQKMIQQLQLAKQQLNVKIQTNNTNIKQLQLKNKQLVNKLNNVKVYTDTLSSQQINEFIDNFLKIQTQVIVR